RPRRGRATRAASATANRFPPALESVECSPMVLQDVDAALGDFAAVLRRVVELFIGSDARWVREELTDASGALGVRFPPIGPLAKSADGVCEGFAVRV